MFAPYLQVMTQSRSDDSSESSRLSVLDQWFVEQKVLHFDPKWIKNIRILVKNS